MQEEEEGERLGGMSDDLKSVVTYLVVALLWQVE